MRSGYYDRGSHPFRALCLEHGEARWGDPMEGDGRAAFDARYDDKSGDWCWDPNVGDVECMECGQ